jgi:hypothetical protein
VTLVPAPQPASDGAPAEAERIRAYLVAESARLSLRDLVDKLRRDVLPLREAAARVPAGRFHERPGPEEWSAADVYSHILDMTEHGDASVRAMLAGDRPPPVRDVVTGELRPGLDTAEDCWRAFQALREPFYARVLGARGDEHLDITARHPWFGPLNWREWVLFMRVHDLAHLGQIEAIAARLAG